MTTPQQTITLTPAALGHIKKMQSQQHDGDILRLSVKKTGCSGYGYVMQFIQREQETDRVFIQTDGLRVCVDNVSLPLLNGVTVDYVRDGLNASFRYINPNESGACGCGESFTID